MREEKMSEHVDHHDPDSMTLEEAIERAEAAWDALKEMGIDPREHYEE